MKDLGGAAFPCHNDSALEYNWISSGMTLRDYFAAKAMQGMITGTHMWADKEDDDLAGCAYDLADAMLKARGQ